MPHTSTIYWVESKKEGERDKIVAHTKKGRKLYHEFISKNSAMKLLLDEKEANPDIKYRLCKKKTEIILEKWQ